MKRILILTVSIFVLIIGLCGCQKSVDSSEITFEDMTFTLPDGDWYYGENENVYESDDCRVFIDLSDDERYGQNGDIWFEYFTSDSFFVGYPSCKYMYIDGYVAEFDFGEDGISMMIDYDGGDYYYISIHYKDEGDKKTAKAQMKQILESIEFIESGDRPWIGAPCEDAVTEFKEAIEEGYTDEGIVQGKVADVQHATNSNGKPFYIDLGNAYPDTARVTGVIWEEYQSDFDESELFGLYDREVILWGEAEMYDGIVNIRIEDHRQVLPIYEIDDL